VQFAFISILDGADGRTRLIDGGRGDLSEFREILLLLGAMRQCNKGALLQGFYAIV